MIFTPAFRAAALCAFLFTAAGTPARAEQSATPGASASFDAVTASEQGQAGEAAAPAVPDPCAAFAGSYESYYLCQDRVKRIERMNEAQQRRAGKAGIATPQLEPSVEEKQDDPEARIEALEKRLQEKEAEAAKAEADRKRKERVRGNNRNTMFR